MNSKSYNSNLVSIYTSVMWTIYYNMLPRRWLCRSIPYCMFIHIRHCFIYLGFGQPPLQFRFITFLLATSLFVYIYNPRWLKLETLNFTLIPAHIDTRMFCLTWLGYVVLLVYI